MVFPVADDNSDRTLFPLVTIALIVLNVFVFVVLQGMGENDDVTLAYCQVPAEILSGRDVVTEPSVREIAVQGQQLSVSVPGLRPTPIPVWLTLLTGIFMHGSVMHLLGNMWFLWLFGDNVEDCMGHVRYTLFYLATGIIASLAFVATNATGEAALRPKLVLPGAFFDGDRRLPRVEESRWLVVGGWLLGRVQLDDVHTPGFRVAVDRISLSGSSLG